MGVVANPPETEPESRTAPEPPQQETEPPTPVEGEEGAAPAEDAAAVAQVEVTPPEKPDYITREEWEKERNEVARQAAEKALEEDRRRRQTENARKAQQEERHKARIQQTAEKFSASLITKGFEPEMVRAVLTDEALLADLTALAQVQAEGLIGDQARIVGEAWDYFTGPVYGQKVDLDAEAEQIGRAHV